MPNTLDRPRHAVRNVLARILDEPALVAEVRALPAAALAKLIDHVGLEDAGELVALATTEQIARVFDEDLWTRDAPGRDDRFDAERFVVWLEILLEAGERVAAQRLLELDVDVITLALQRLVLVVDVDALASEISEGIHEDGDAISKALESTLNHEVGEFMVVARQHHGWDAILLALLAVDEVDHDACVRLLERLTALTSREADDEGGLYEVLTAEDSLEDDVRGDRNERRAGEGFIAASDARAFLRLARDYGAKSGERDAVTKAYFRELDRTPKSDIAPSRLLSMLDRAGITRTKAKKAKALPHTRRVHEEMATLPPARQAEIMEELAYLVNVLIAGDERHWRPAEAAEKVVAVVAAGLASLETDLLQESAVNAFRAGVRAGKLG